MWRESLHCTLVWMILQTKHEITSIHLNDQLHWLYLANSNNLPLLLPTPLFSPRSCSLHLSNLIFHSSLSPTSSPFLISAPLSNVRSLLLYLHNLSNPSSLSFPHSSPINFFIPPCHLSGVCCSFFLVFLLLSVRRRNPPSSLRIRAYWLGLWDRKVDDEWQRGTANANGDL